MSNWEDEDWEDSTSLPQPSTSVAAGDWDDEDEEGLETIEEPMKIAPAPMKPKKALELALKAKEEEERRREVEAIAQREKELSELSQVERKLREQKIVEDADLENTKDLFGNDEGGGMKVPDGPTLETFEPKTDEDFKKLAGMVGDRICPFNDNPRKTGRYIDFLKLVFRAVTKDLSSDDTKDLSTFVGVIGNEKREEFKKSKGIKKKVNKKASVKVDRADMRSDLFDDFADDFM